MKKLSILGIPSVVLILIGAAIWTWKAKVNDAPDAASHIARKLTQESKSEPADGIDSNQKGVIDIKTVSQNSSVKQNVELSKELVDAGIKGDFEKLKALLEQGADPNASIGEGPGVWTALHSAAAQGRVDIVKALLEKGADPNLRAGDGLTPLMRAWGASTEVMKLLIEKGADMNAQTKDGKTVLMMAADHNSTRAIQVLLEAGADANIEDSSGDTAWNYALRGRREEALDLLEKAGAVGKVDLFAAATAGDLQGAAFLINRGSDVNARNAKKDQTPLFLAAQKGYTDLVKLMIEKGADINAISESTQSALVAAIKNGHVDTVKLLLEKGADLNITSDSTIGYSALSQAIYYNKPEIAKILLEHKASLLPKEIEAVLNAAILSGQFDILEPLRKNGMTHTPTLFTETLLNNVSTLKELIRRGADVNARLHPNATYSVAPLMLAVEARNFEVAKVLLENGADINIKYDANYTPLMKAASKGDKQMVQFLLENGATLNYEQQQLLSKSNLDPQVKELLYAKANK